MTTSDTAQRYMVVQLGRIGDLVLHTPMFRALKQHQPECELHVLVSKHNAPVVEQHPLVDHVFVNTKKVGHTLKLLHHLRTTPYTAWIDPKYHHSSESRLFARVSRSPMKIGFNPDGKGPFTHPLIINDEHEHEHLADHCLRSLQYLHIKNNQLQPILYVNEQSAVQFNQFLRERHIEAFCCVNISANAPDRGWPWDRWVPFLKAINHADRHSVLISAPRHREHAKEFEVALQNTHYYATQSIVDVFSVIARSDIVITPDTSIVHISAAFDKPLLAFYVNLRDFYSKFYPLSTHFRAVMHPKPGALVIDISLHMAIEHYQSLQAEIEKVKKDE